MKKLLTIALISLIALASSFAAQQGSVDKNLNVTINASVAFDQYDLNISYADVDLTDSELVLNDSSYVLNNTSAITTKAFDVHTDKGNQNMDMALTVVVTPSSFKGLVNGKNVNTGIIPSVVKTAESAGDYTLDTIGGARISNIITAGPNPAMSLANFSLRWVGNETVAAGDYSSNVTINYTLN